MKTTPRHNEISANIDGAIRAGDFESVPLASGRQIAYVDWYAKLLTTLTLVVGESSIVYSQTDYSVDAGTVRFVLLTEQIVVVIDGAGLQDQEPQICTRVIGRKSLVSFDPTASMRLDQAGTKSYLWPGDVQIAARYTGLSEPLLFTSAGSDADRSEHPGPALGLLKALLEDLGR